MFCFLKFFRAFFQTSAGNSCLVSPCLPCCRSKAKHDQLYQDLQELRLPHIADYYGEVLDEAWRKNTTMLDILLQLVSGQLASRRDGALARRVRAAHLPPLKTLAEYDFTFPRKISKPKILRLFDLQFV